MKSLITVCFFTAASFAASAQVKFVDAPYPNAVTYPSAAQQGSSSGVLVTPAAQSPNMQGGFEILQSDQNLRRALVRWTKLIGWTFEPEHWTLDRDIPVSGSASLGSDFKLATRSLLSSTEMTDLPAQPCFYTNNVLRVIPLNELCSRQQAMK